MTAPRLHGIADALPDTGWRDVTALITKNDGVTSWPILLGRLHIRRVGDTVYSKVQGERIRIDRSADTTSSAQVTLPTGWRGAVSSSWPWGCWDVLTAHPALFFTAVGALPNSGPLTPFPVGSTGGDVFTSASWLTAEPWPTVLPGIPTS